MFKKQLNKQKGFTLIEMVVVIAVMGVLMGVAFRGFGTIQANSRDTRRIADLRNVQTQLELYFLRCGHYPTGTTDCGAAQTVETGVLNWTELTTRLSLVMPEGTPSERHPGHPLYEYRFGLRGQEYVVSAIMERRGNNPEVRGTSVVGLDCGTLTLPGNRFCLRN